jgi:hypothetical protein
MEEVLVFETPKDKHMVRLALLSINSLTNLVHEGEDIHPTLAVGASARISVPIPCLNNHMRLAVPLKHRVKRQ